MEKEFGFAWNEELLSSLNWNVLILGWIVDYIEICMSIINILIIYGIMRTFFQVGKLIKYGNIVCWSVTFLWNKYWLARMFIQMRIIGWYIFVVNIDFQFGIWILWCINMSINKILIKLRRWIRCFQVMLQSILHFFQLWKRYFCNNLFYKKEGMDYFIKKINRIETNRRIRE